MTTPPIGTKAENIGDAIDAEPWEFPKHKPFVQSSVAALNKRDPKVCRAWSPICPSSPTCSGCSAWR